MAASTPIRPFFPSLRGFAQWLGWAGLLVWIGACSTHSTGSPQVATASAQPPVLATAAQHIEGPLSPGSLLVELRAGHTLPADPAESQTVLPPHPGLRLGGVALHAVRRLHDPVPWDPSSGEIWLLRSSDPTAQRSDVVTRSLLSAVATDPIVRRAEPDRIRYATSDAGPIDGGSQDAGTRNNGPGRRANDRFFAQQWNLPLVRAPEAWNISGGAEDVVVAILDTGILPSHPDLAGRLLPGYDFISRPESADDGDTRRDADPTDTGTLDSSRLHGTHVAGIIGAATGNRLGIAGIDQRCRLLPVRVLGVRNGDGVDSDISDAVRWAAGIPVGDLPPPAQAADVLNLSFGGPVVSFTLQRAVQQAIARGALVVVAAGNGGDDARTYSPGGLDDVISVGAIGRDGKRAPYSNYGPRVDLLAPGGSADLIGDEDAGFSVEGVLSTYRDDGLRESPEDLYTYGVLSGTSQAAPHVSAAAALARGLFPTLRQSGLALLLAATANRRYRCENDPLQGCGAGLLDIASLLALSQRQAGCGCMEGQICLDDGICRTPQQLHDPLVPDNRIHGGWCQLARPLTDRSRAIVPSGWWLFVAGLLLLRSRRFRSRFQVRYAPRGAVRVHSIRPRIQ